MDNDSIQKAFEAAWKASGKNSARFINELKLFESTWLKNMCKGRRMVNETEDDSRYLFYTGWATSPVESRIVHSTDGRSVWSYDEHGKIVEDDVRFLVPTEALSLANEVWKCSWSESNETDINND